MKNVFEMFKAAVNEQAILDLTNDEVDELMEIFRKLG
jgi:hypothetical protein